MTVLALDSSVNPMMDVSAVLLTICTAKPTAGRRFPLPLGNGFHAAAPALGQESARPQRQRRAGGPPGRHFHAQQRQAEERQEQLHQERRALEQFDIGPAGAPHHGHAGRPHHQRQHAHQRAAGERHQRQHRGPARGQEQVADDVPG
ncbi:hypothetical protein G6F31_016590 [Rhizopus arrhizus]|nr:hypothetical protein G6F31_016590 [Rhizopus arrhizus]